MATDTVPRPFQPVSIQCAVPVSVAAAKRAKARYELRARKADCPRGRKPGIAMVARQGDQDEEYDRALDTEAQLIASMKLQRIWSRACQSSGHTAVKYGSNQKK